MDIEVHKIIDSGRDFLKPKWNLWKRLQNDQALGVPVPEFEKEYCENSELIDLLSFDNISCGKESLADVISKRKSRRKYNKEAITIEELSYLLWATQGVREYNEKCSLRTVPSAGARHCFETYLFIDRVSELKKGLYRYLPLENKLCLIAEDEDLKSKLNYAMFGQNYNCAVTFIWTAIPYRAEWRYSIASHKMIAIDAGHVCQNLYLAAESIKCGCCAIGAYEQEKIDEFLHVDGQEEFAIYMATVGRYD